MGIVQKAGDLASDLSGDRRAPVAIAVDQRGGVRTGRPIADQRVVPCPSALSRVEDGRGGLGHSASPRFPSPLIKPDVRISRIRLSD
jgi:hypothetical protein